MLLTPIKADRLLALCADDNWVMQPKENGHRLLVRIKNGELKGFQRQGVYAKIQTPFLHAQLVQVAMSLSHGWIDGEYMPESREYRVFDASFLGVKTTEERLVVVKTLGDSLGWDRTSSVISTVPVAWTEAEKLDLIHRVKYIGGEGVVARYRFARYEEGKRSRCALKWKHTKECDAFVTGVGRDGKDNLVLSMYHGTEVVEVACVKAPLTPVPLGGVVTVTYLRVSSHGRLVEPVNAHARLDKSALECTTDQLS